MQCLGIVTIGQAPREDMVPELRRWLGGVDVTERGALDHIGARAIADLAPAAGGPLLVSRMRDGTEVRLDAGRIHPLLCGAVEDVEARGAEVTLVVCTGEMAYLPHQRMLLSAETLISHGVRAISAGERLGIVCPDPGQALATRARWALVSQDPLVAPASPYAPDTRDQVANAARALADGGARFIVLDCMGYSLDSRLAASAASGLPVLLARALVGSLAAAAAEAASGDEGGKAGTRELA
jgi:protein AroM